MRHEAIELDEAAFIEQDVQSFARGELPLIVLRLDARTPAALLGLGASLLEQGELVFHRHRSGKVTEPSWSRESVVVARKTAGRSKEKRPAARSCYPTNSYRL